MHAFPSLGRAIVLNDPDVLVPSFVSVAICPSGAVANEGGVLVHARFLYAGRSIPLRRHFAPECVDNVCRVASVFLHFQCMVLERCLSVTLVRWVDADYVSRRYNYRRSRYPWFCVYFRLRFLFDSLGFRVGTRDG